MISAFTCIIMYVNKTHLGLQVTPPKFILPLSPSQLSHHYPSLVGITCPLFIHLTNWRQFFFYISPGIDHVFYHDIVKVAVDPQGDSQVDLQTTLTML